jgi:hypothetical protein
MKAVRCESGKAVQALLTPIADTPTNGDLPALTLDSRENPVCERQHALALGIPKSRSLPR